MPKIDVDKLSLPELEHVASLENAVKVLAATLIFISALTEGGATTIEPDKRRPWAEKIIGPGHNNAKPVRDALDFAETLE